MRLPKTIKHLLIPHHANNHKARLRHPKGFAWLAVLALLIPLLIDFSPPRGSILGYATAISAEEVWQLTNEQRLKNGLPPLKSDPQLVQAATAKANDMFTHNYWAHVSPTGVQPWSFFNSAGYSYSYAGENLARDFNVSDDVVKAWMDSPTHRDNILNSKYEDIGIATVNGILDGVETTLVVQEFGTRKANTQVARVVAEPTQALIRPTSTPTPMPEIMGETQVEPTPLPPMNNDEDGESIVVGSMENPPVGRAMISPMTVTKSWVLAISLLVAAVFAIDMFVIHKIKLPRVGGKTLAHMMVLMFVIGAILFTQSGVIK